MSYRSSYLNADVPEDAIDTPSVNPPSGKFYLYFKSDGNLYRLDSSGTEVKVGPSTGGGTQDKAYFHGNTYNTVLLEFTSSAYGFSVSDGYVIPYQTSDGTWFIKGNVTATITGASSIGVAISGGFTFPVYEAACVYNGWAYTGASGDAIVIDFHSNYSNVWLSFDVKVSNKPTWAD